MENLITKLESKVKDCNNTNTIFDNRKYVLLDDVKDLILHRSRIKMKFKDAPIGARFLFPESKDIWLKINSFPKSPYNDGTGLVVKWNGNTIERQSHCCWLDEENGYDFDTLIELLD